MNRQAQAIILLLLGGAVLRASLTDQYLNYVKPGLHLFLIAAGVILVAAGSYTLWQDLKPTRTSRQSVHPHQLPPRQAADAQPLLVHGHQAPAHVDTHDDSPDGGPDVEGHDDGHTHHSPLVAWLLILPALGLLLIAPPSLGSYAAGRAGTAVTAPTSDFAALPEGDPARISLLDYASRAVFDEGRSLGERQVQLSGFVMPGPDGSRILARMIISCCAADARPIKVALNGDLPDGLTGDPDQEQWLQIVGVYDSKMVKDPVNGENIPFIKVLEAKVIPTPTEQYES